MDLKKNSKNNLDTNLKETIKIFEDHHIDYWICHGTLLGIIRDDELIEIKGDRKSIGEANAEIPFSKQKIEIKNSDIFYLFTDGFADQFGGPNKKKLKIKGLKEILTSNTNKSMRHQKHRIEDAFEIWKGDIDQIDDVCIMGFII